MADVFLSYRRSDAEGWAGRLSHSLRAELGDAIFRDIESIPAGADYASVIAEQLKSCAVLLALIGPRWRDARLEDPEDLLRHEIASALRAQKKILVIPVLVGGAKMPSVDDLPDDIKLLAGRQHYELTERRWIDDCRKLATTLQPLVRDPSWLKLLWKRYVEGRHSRRALLTATAMLTVVLALFIIYRPVPRPAGDWIKVTRPGGPPYAYAAYVDVDPGDSLVGSDGYGYCKQAGNAEAQTELLSASAARISGALLRAKDTSSVVGVLSLPTLQRLLLDEGIQTGNRELLEMIRLAKSSAEKNSGACGATIVVLPAGSRKVQVEALAIPIPHTGKNWVYCATPDRSGQHACNGPASGSAWVWKIDDNIVTALYKNWSPEFRATQFRVFFDPPTEWQTMHPLSAARSTLDN